MKTYYLKSTDTRILADTLTPVSIYLNLRDKFANSLLLESSDYHGMENSFSYICFEPISTFSLLGLEVNLNFPEGRKETIKLESKKDALTILKDYASAFVNEPNTYKFINNGLFGYLAYDAVEYFEDIDFSDNAPSGYDIPQIHYAVYKYVIAVDHFKNELYLFEHSLEGAEEESQIDRIITLIKARNYPTYQFKALDDESSNYTDEDFKQMVQKGIDHCLRGDVIQVVLSRRFQTSFHGDEFNVYRTLRSINPSPYLFYFDYGNFKIFGSAPEAQIQIKDQKAIIYPIAGTFKRTGNDKEDLEMAKKLANDPKEIAEHVMLVDLARNDLSRNSYDVEVETFKEVQYYSHVIHLVSKVSGHLDVKVSPVQLVADTFPAGTLSGAPKHMAMQLINKYENIRRGFYGGAIGFMGFSGDFNHAIMIRSFLSKNNVLFYQAGAGVVSQSVPENELQEVNNKLAALRKALGMAESIKD
jgi:anthranilate synthase component I